MVEGTFHFLSYRSFWNHTYPFSSSVRIDRSCNPLNPITHTQFQEGDLIISAIRAQGLPTTVGIVQVLSSVKSQKPAPTTWLDGHRRLTFPSLPSSTCMHPHDRGWSCIRA